MIRKLLNLLLAEDSDDDALLVLNALERQGYEVQSTRVFASNEFRSVLEDGDFDIILCDYVMPSFDAIEALDILHESGKDIPLIIVSGKVGEVVAVEAMKHGAADYLLKDNLIRLGAAVERELREGETRRQKRLSDGFSRSQTEVLEMILDGVPLPRILERIAERVASLAGNGTRCWIMLSNPEGSHLLLGAATGFADGLFESLGPLPIGADMGCCGAAAALGKVVVLEDISKHADWAALRELTRKNGLRSCWAVPVFSAGRSVLGTMGLFHRSSGSPSPEEIQWVESASKLVSIAIERSRDAENVKSSEALLRIASDATHIGGWIVDFPANRITWSDQVCAIHEMPPGTSPGFDEALQYYAPEWRDRISQVFEKCLFEGISFDEEMQIITARGRLIWVRAIGEGIRDDNGTVTRIQGAFEDITEKKLADETIRANELRYLVQRNALITLTRETQPDTLKIADAFLRITETTATTLDVARVSIWRYTPDGKAIECLDLYELSLNRHSSGATLVASDYPCYFECLEEMELIAADDAVNDPCTCEFSPGYLAPLGIGAMMDVPVRLGNRVDYLICCEHVGPARCWTPDEKTFAVAIANLVSLSLEIRGRTLAQEEVLKSHQRFQSVASATNDTIWDWNLDTNAFWWNDGFANLFGWSATEDTGTIRAWIRQIHPEDRNRVVAGIFSAIHKGDTNWTDEYRFVSNDGSISHVLDRGQVIRDSSGKGIRMVGGMMDLTSSKAAELALGRSHRALQMFSSCNEMLIRASDESALLADACRIAVEIGGYRMAWVGYALDDERRQVVPMAHAGEEHGYLSEIEMSWSGDHPSGHGPSGLAIRTGETVVFTDGMEEAGSSVWAELARKRGYLSAVSLPLRNAERVFGVLCLYGAESHAVGEEEIKMLREMANDLSFGIENIRSRKERQRTEEVVIKVAQAVSSGTGSEFFDLLTRNMVEALGARGGLIGKFNPAANTIDTISYMLDGKRMGNVGYGLAGTPCADVAAGNICVFEQGVRDAFPEDHLLATLGVESYAGIPLTDQSGGVAGIMVVFFSSPLHETALVKSTLRIFAARAASELDRRQADARIREQASLLDKARDAIVVRDLNHTITYWNKSAERMYGWTAEEALGRSVVDLLYRESPDFFKAHEQTVHKGEWLGELTQIDKAGRDLNIEGRWNLVHDDKGLPQSVLAINTDISEYRKLELQFIRAQRLESIGTLAGGIAHDLNNILAPISMAVELLKMRAPDESYLELLDTIAASAQRGANMVGQILSFARGMEGRHARVHPRQIISEIECILRDTFPRNIGLHLQAGDELWTIHGDPTQIHQVLLNLCVNSRDAIAGAGEISISAKNVEIDDSFAAVNLEAREGPYVCIQVEDTGEGIPPEIMDRIFDPFFTTKAVGKGTGLGLPTTLAIVKGHGGFIRIHSKPREGTVVRVYIPAHPAFNEPVQSSGPVHLPRGGGEIILIVDDEAPILEIAREVLETFGYRTLIASNGDEALSIYVSRQSEIDVVLTDMMMPVMDGREMISRISRINPAVRIIATSGVASNVDPSNQALENVRNFLPKPYTAEALLKCLRQVLEEEII